MATKTFLTSKDAVVVLRNSDSGSLGAGKDYHIYVGNSGDYTIRGLVQFNLDFSDVTAITNATLYFTTARSSDGTVDGYLRDAHGTYASAAMYISRVTSSWTEGTYGNDEGFNGANSVEWSNQPSTTTTNRVSFTSRSSRPSSPTLDSMDVTAMVTDWFNGSANYGIQIKYQSETGSRYTEWYSREGDASTISGAVAPYIVLTYSTVTNPTGTPTNPSGTVAKITNLSDTTEWTNTTQLAMPEFNWSYTSGGGGEQNSWRLRIYSDSSKTTTYYDTGTVIDSEHKSDLKFSPVKNAEKQSWVPGTGWSNITGLVNGTQYFWTIQVSDPLGNTSAESATTGFRVRWGQAVYEWDAGASYASTGAWSITHAQPPANTQAVVRYRVSASSGATTGAWSSEIGPLIATQRYLQTLIRMSTDDGTMPYITDITFSYTTSAVPPDNWSVNSGNIILDSNERRFGTKSALWRPSTTGASSVQPTRASGEYDIPVLQNTRYTFSAYVKPVTIAGRTLKLRVFKSNGSTASATGLTEIADINGVTASKDYSQFTADNEGWYRLTYTFETDSSTDYVKPVIYLYGTGLATDSLYLDGVQFEEGTVVRSWTPGFVTQAMTFEGAGLNIDGSTGGKLRLRGSDGGVRNVVQLGDKGLTFGGATSPANLYSPGADVLASDQQIRSYFSPAFRAETTTSTGTAFRSLAVGDTYGRLNIKTDGNIEWGSGSAAADTNLYRGGADILKTDDSLWVAGNTLSSVDRLGSADSTTITYATEYYALTNAETTFTPTFVGQRWLLTLTGYVSLNTTTVQYAFVRGSVNNSAVAVSTAARSLTTATINTSTAHGMIAGDTFIIALTSGPTNFAQLNGLYTVASAPTTTSFTYTAPSSGTITSGAAVGSVYKQVTNLGFSRADNYGVTGRGGTVALTKVYTATTADVPLVFKFTGTVQTTAGLTLSMAYTQINAYPLG